MRGKDFLRVADYLLRAKPAGEPHWRAAAGRAYYALFLEGRDWLRGAGFDVDASKATHYDVPRLLSFSEDVDVQCLGRALIRMHDLRKEADYEMSGDPVPQSSNPRSGEVHNRSRNSFGHPREATEAIRAAQSFIDRLRNLEANVNRRKLVIESIQKNMR